MHLKVVYLVALWVQRGHFVWRSWWYRCWLVKYIILVYIQDKKHLNNSLQQPWPCYHIVITTLSLMLSRLFWMGSSSLQSCVVRDSYVQKDPESMISDHLITTSIRDKDTWERTCCTVFCWSSTVSVGDCMKKVQRCCDQVTTNDYSSVLM